MKPKVIEFDNNVFDEAEKAFCLNVVSFEKKLVKLNADNYLPRFNKIRLKCISNYSQSILFLKVLRTGSTLNNENFYSFPLMLDNISIGNTYEISFLHFDAFNLPFDQIDVSIMKSNEYAKRKLNENAVKRAKLETLSVKEVS